VAYDPDPFSVLSGVLQNLFVRLLLFAATVALSVFLGLLVPDLIPAGWFLFAVIVSLFAVPAVSIIVLIALARAESTAGVCFALAMNCVVWFLGTMILTRVSLYPG
jgi:hypothetical protein